MINGWIFSLAVKKPANTEKAVHRIIARIRAIITLSAIGILSKFQGPIPKNVTILVPLWSKSDVVTEPRATILPTLRSVPAKRIKPATPRA